MNHHSNQQSFGAKTPENQTTPVVQAITTSWARQHEENPLRNSKTNLVEQEVMEMFNSNVKMGISDSSVQYSAESKSLNQPQPNQLFLYCPNSH